MSVFHHKELPCESLSSYLQFGASDVFLAAPYKGNTIAVWCINDLQIEPILLRGHKRQVNAVYLTENTLFSAGFDYIIRWKTADFSDQNIRGSVICNSPGEVTRCLCNEVESLLVAAVSDNLYICDLKTKEYKATFETHQRNVTDIQFINNDILVSVADDKYFIVWDLKNLSILHQSALLPPHPPFHLSINLSLKQLFVTTFDSILLSFDVSENFKLIDRTDLTKCLSDVKNSRSDMLSEPREVLCIIFIENVLPSQQKDELSNKALTMVVGTQEKLAFIDAHTFQTIALRHFKEGYQTDMMLLRQCQVIPDRLWIFTKSSSNLNVFSTMIPFEKNIPRDYQYSAVSQFAVMNDSALKKQLTLKVTDTLTSVYKGIDKMNVKFGGLDKKGKILDKQPLTFNKKIKSSGYNAPKISKQKETTPSSVCIYSTKEVMKESKLDCLEYKKKVSLGTSPINHLLFANDSSLVCSSTDGAINVLKHNLKEEKALQNHNGVITSLHVSNDGRLILSGGEDKQCCVSTRDGVIMRMQAIEGNMKNNKNEKNYSDIITSARFIYMDHILTVCCCNHLYLYNYAVDNSKTELKRQLNNSRYKLIYNAEFPSFNQICAFSSINSFFSYIGIVAGSNKSLHVYDFNQTKCLRIIEDCHERSVHVVTQYSGNNENTKLHDLFLTSSLCDSVKLWDLRSPKSVRKYNKHQCRTQKCHVAFSSCGGFIGCCSEDKKVYLYDLRNEKDPLKAPSTDDITLSLSFRPSSQQLVVGTTNGNLETFA